MKSDQLIRQQKALNLPDTHKKFVAKDQVAGLPIPSKGIGAQLDQLSKPLRKIGAVG